MLSRFAIIRNQGTAMRLIPMFQSTSAAVKPTPSAEVDISRKEFPPATSKRDFENFPRMMARKERPPVRLGFIPDSWFQFFYPKTGYTGPYMLLVTVGTYLISKEKIVIDHNMSQALAFVLAIVVINKTLGPKLKNFLTDFCEKRKVYLDNLQEYQKTDILNGIKNLEFNDTLKKALAERTLAKKEFVLLQMEAAYRERIIETYKTIKNRLDCMSELENSQRRSTQKNLVDYVLRNVNKAITPELEKSALQNCIKELNALAMKA